MDKDNLNTQYNRRTSTSHVSGYFVDLLIYLSVMFLIREVYFESLNFIANGLFWSGTTLIIAIWRMKVRGVTWRDLGLRRPSNFKKMFLISVGILGATVLSMIAFQLIKDQLPIELTPDTSSESSTSKFGDLSENWMLFFAIIPFVLLESALEELLDRGFLMNWLERTFSKTSIATILAVLLQAAIFGFRHSYDLSERSVTVGIIGLIMGVAYVLFGRNLWPLIITHCILNTISMVGRV